MKNVSFQGFNWNGLTLEYADATNNTISGCWLGSGLHRQQRRAERVSGHSDRQPGASRNTIGGTNALARNVISGNSQYGLCISDTNTTGNVVLGNYIGTDASGSFAVSNALGGIGLFIVPPDRSSAARMPSRATSFPATSVPASGFPAPA